VKKYKWYNGCFIFLTGKIFFPNRRKIV